MTLAAADWVTMVTVLVYDGAWEVVRLRAEKRTIANDGVKKIMTARTSFLVSY